MEFRKMVMITPYARQQKRHRCIQQASKVTLMEKSTFESVLMRWMKLEPIIQSEVSQKEKHQYSILTHIYGI